MLTQKRVEVIFDGAAIGIMEIQVRHAEARDEAVARCLALLGLRPCREQEAVRRCPPSGGLHAHILRARFDNEHPVVRGERIYLIATLPIVGGISYNFDADHPVTPAITFREVAVDVV